MDFDREYDLENAGIDAFDFSLMDDDERAEALRDAGLDPDDFDGVEFDSSFDAWSALQDNGLSLWELDLMDDDEKREALEEAGLDPDDYETLPAAYPVSYSAPSTPPVQQNTHPADNKKSVPPLEPPKVYRFCGVNFPGYNRSYAYLANGWDVSVGDIVMVPTGPENTPSVAKVVSVGNYTAEVAPYPVERTKSILRKATQAESAPFITQVEPPSVSTAQPPSTTTHTPAPKEERTAPASSYTTEAKPKKNTSAWWILAVAAVIVFFIAVGQPSKTTPTRSTSSTYSSSRSTGSSSYTYSSNYSTTPTCPPVNRELAMTREEAERLSGTGYHGTRPNSSAEISELKAAQVRCKNCGYRSHNGLNSLCDYCAWMERYGGGLPSQKAPDVTPKPTPRPTPKPTPRPTTKPQTSDPYHASDYAHPEDFYYDYYDDFWDYEDAEDYWEEYN